MQSRALRPFAIRLAIVILVALAASAAIYFITQALADSSLAARAATCTKTGCFCEAPLASIPKQLADSFSSLAFVFLGVWTLLATRGPAVGTPERRLTPLFGIVFVFIGASSFFYHSTLSFFGQFLDIFSMYAFGILLAIGALYRARKLRGAPAIMIFVALSAIFAVVQYLLPDARRVLFAALLLPGIILELTPFITGFSPRSPRVRFIYWGVGTLVVAYVIWLLDQNPAFCDSGSLLQGHAVWHVLTAISAFLIVAHYRQTPHVTA
ncbi:MAG: ceramidase domain-containing protein [Rhodoglobus sp.]